MSAYEHILVSVSMPAYNAAQYIGEAIESILSQSHRNLELIVIDDGSKDDTLSVIQSYRDPRIVALTHSENRGLVATRNEITQMARGKYIAFLDADDKAFSTRLEKQLGFLERNPIDICGTDYWVLNDQDGSQRKSKQSHSDIDIRALMTIYSPLCNPSIMGRAAVFKDNLYRAEYGHAEDYCFWVDLALKGYSFSNLQERLMVYRLHATQTSITHQAAARQIFLDTQQRYLQGLGISLADTPRPIPWHERVHSAPRFLKQVQQIIGKTSFFVNWQIYARFQWRGNGVLRTPFVRLERLIIALWARFVL